MELRQLRYFSVVAEEENFRRAAERLNVAQPALSRQIAALEAELGVALFTRARRRIRLSAAGKAYLKETTKLLADLALMNERVRQVAAGQVGALHIAFHETAGRSRVVARSLQSFRAQFPNVDLRLSQLTSQQQIEALESGAVDGGFLYPSSLGETGLASFRVSTDRFYLAVSRLHPLAARDRVRLVELADEPFVVISRAKSPRFHDLMLAACLKGGLRPAILQQTESEATLVNLVAIGMASALVISSTSRSWHPDVTLVRVADLAATLDLHFAWNADLDPPHIRNFVSCVEAAVEEWDEGAAAASIPRRPR